MKNQQQRVEVHHQLRLVENEERAFNMIGSLGCSLLLHALMCSKLLWIGMFVYLCSGMEDKFAVNDQFTSKLHRLKVQAVASQGESDHEEGDETESRR